MVGPPVKYSKGMWTPGPLIRPFYWTPPRRNGPPYIHVLFESTACLTAKDRGERKNERQVVVYQPFLVSQARPGLRD